MQIFVRRISESILSNFELDTCIFTNMCTSPFYLKIQKKALSFNALCNINKFLRKTMDIFQKIIKYNIIFE